MEISYSKNRQSVFSVTKVFGLMFLALLISAGTSIGLYYLLVNGALSFETYKIMSLFSVFGLLVSTLFVQFVCLKYYKGGIIAFIIHSIIMGILLSSFMLVYSITFLGYIFLATAGSFGSMAIYGLITKRNTFALGMFGVGALMGVLLLTLINIFLASEILYYFISYISLAGILAITAYDVNRIKQLSLSGELNKNLSIYFALQLYTDFIYIFIRLVRMLGIKRGK